MRDFRDKLLEMVEEGRLDKDQVILGFAKHMSQAQIEDMMYLNEFLPDTEEEEE